MWRRRKKADPDDGIVVLSKTEPPMCGGTDAYQDTRAPKEILSQDMTLFDVTSALGYALTPEEEGTEPLGFISAFAAPAKEGTFLFLETAPDERSGDITAAWALVKEDMLPKLTALVREHDLAKQNGFHSRTHGLPQDFGGRVRIQYASGEEISFSDNQTPVLSIPLARTIAALFTEAMNGPRVALPGVDSLKEIRFAEEREGGGFTRATLTLLPDGSGVNAKVARYDDPQVYESEKPVDAETVAAIKDTIESNGILAWEGLPESGFALSGHKTLTFVLADGRAIVIPDGQVLPDPLGRGFFSIELEMTTKH
ncbi:MAG: hypothetical protein IKI63_05810 [Clostridia bacterium]|nr:hypothetical protein [Clostridia bacterium]